MACSTNYDFTALRGDLIAGGLDPEVVAFLDQTTLRPCPRCGYHWRCHPLWQVTKHSYWCIACRPYLGAPDRSYEETLVDVRARLAEPKVRDGMARARRHLPARFVIE